uniref:Uncharacterized protein n=1 Tax=Heterorhabditis bacteriophora TaxID=37862 RepID=A0A1I7X5B7_HETBA
MGEAYVPGSSSFRASGLPVRGAFSRLSTPEANFWNYFRAVRSFTLSSLKATQLFRQDSGALEASFNS